MLLIVVHGESAERFLMGLEKHSATTAPLDVTTLVHDTSQDRRDEFTPQRLSMSV